MIRSRARREIMALKMSVISVLLFPLLFAGPALASSAEQRCADAATKKQQRESLKFNDSFEFISFEGGGEENVFGSFEIDLRYRVDDEKKKRTYKCNKHGSIESVGDERWDYSPSSGRRKIR